LVASRPEWISSFITSSVPLPRDPLSPATTTASYRLSVPSADMEVEGRMDATSTIGLSPEMPKRQICRRSIGPRSLITRGVV